MASPVTVARGVTARSVCAALFGIAAVATTAQAIEVVVGSHFLFGQYALPLPAMYVFIPLVLVSGAFYAVTRRRLLTQPEFLVVLFSMFFAAPLVSVGFWTYFVGTIGTIPKTADFETYDALPSTFWPQGPDLLHDALTRGRRDAVGVIGDVEWTDGPEKPALYLRNSMPGERASIRIPVAVGNDRRTGIVPGQPYLFTALLRPEDLGPEAYFYGRIYHDDRTHFATEAFASRATPEVNYLHPDGYLRRGMYGLVIGDDAEQVAWIEIGLAGQGELAVDEVELIDVGTLNTIYQGRKRIGDDRYAAMGTPDLSEIVVQPANLWSWAGIRYIVSGYVPWREWLRPVITWGSYALLLLTGTLGIALLFRRQWMESERYPLPLTRLPLAFLGEPGSGDGDALPALWRRKTVWVGFGLAMFWCLMKAWHAYNATVPNMNVEVELAPYFTSPAWGETWHGKEVRNVTFAVSALILGVCVFMELHILMSLVAGFFLFRAQYWFGETTGLALKKDFPFPEHQQVGAYAAYALLILFFARTYLWRAIRDAVRRTTADTPPHVHEHRVAIAALCLSTIGVAVWAHFAGLYIGGMLLFFGYLLAIGLVAAKIRTECGTPLAAFTPVNLAQVLPLLGGMVMFGPAGVIFVIFANWFMFRHTFFLIPGMQAEMAALGSRYRLPTRDVVYTAILGAAGGLIIGAWVFLSLGNAIGGDNFGWRWPYMDKGFLTNDFHLEVARANAALEGAHASAAELGAPAWGYVAGAGGTAAIAILRQLFTGFWFHPVGFIVSSTILMEFAWGSLLTAFVIRAVTVRIGGAVAVRNYLLPFFAGVFLAGLSAHALFALFNAYLYFFHPGVLRQTAVF